MTDRLKGVLVTFDRDIREDDAEPLLNAIKMIRGVLEVKPYIAGAEDHMCYHRGIADCRKRIFDQLMKDPEVPKD